MLSLDWRISCSRCPQRVISISPFFHLPVCQQFNVQQPRTNWSTSPNVPGSLISCRARKSGQERALSGSLQRDDWMQRMELTQLPSPHSHRCHLTTPLDSEQVTQKQLRTRTDRSIGERQTRYQSDRFQPQLSLDEYCFAPRLSSKLNPFRYHNIFRF